MTSFYAPRCHNRDLYDSNHNVPHYYSGKHGDGKQRRFQTRPAPYERPEVDRNLPPNHYRHHQKLRRSPPAPTHYNSQRRPSPPNWYPQRQSQEPTTWHISQPRLSPPRQQEESEQWYPQQQESSAPGHQDQWYPQQQRQSPAALPQTNGHQATYRGTETATPQQSPPETSVVVPEEVLNFLKSESIKWWSVDELIQDPSAGYFTEEYLVKLRAGEVTHPGLFVLPDKLNIPSLPQMC